MSGKDSIENLEDLKQKAESFNQDQEEVPEQEETKIEDKQEETPLQETDQLETKEEIEQEKEQVENELQEQIEEKFNPSFKFKVYDEEKEFDEMFKPLVKDKSSEAKVKELHEKAYGLDVIKPKYKKVREERDTLKEELLGQQQAWNYLTELKKNKDYDTLFKEIQIPKEELYKFVIDDYKRSQDPEAAKLHDQYSEARRQNYKMQKENEQFKTQQQTYILQERQRMLDETLKQNKDFVSAYEKENGEGKFKQDVINFAANHFKMTGEDLSPMEAVKRVTNYYKYSNPNLFNNNNNNQQSVQQPANNQQPSLQPKVIPNVGKGSSNAGGKKTFRSLDELKKHAQQVIGGNNGY